MTARLTPTGYSQTLEKLRDLEQRLADLDRRPDLSEPHREDARRSYERMIRQYRGEIKLYEATLAEQSRQSAP